MLLIAEQEERVKRPIREPFLLDLDRLDRRSFKSGSCLAVKI